MASRHVARWAADTSRRHPRSAERRNDLEMEIVGGEGDLTLHAGEELSSKMPSAVEVAVLRVVLPCHGRQVLHYRTIRLSEVKSEC